MTISLWNVLPAVVAIVIFAFALLAVILWISSFLGWRQWSREHPASPQPEATPSFHFRTGGFAWWACYNNCLRVIITPDGLMVRPIPPFTWFHPWILLPYENLVAAPAVSGFPKHCRVVFSGPRNLHFTLRLPANAGNLIPTHT